MVVASDDKDLCAVDSLVVVAALVVAVVVWPVAVGRAERSTKRTTDMESLPVRGANFTSNEHPRQATKASNMRSSQVRWARGQLNMMGQRAMCSTPRLDLSSRRSCIATVETTKCELLYSAT